MINGSVLLTLFLSGAMCCGAAFIKENIKEHRLDNGLKILLFEDHSIPNIAYYTFFRVGSRNERPGLTGATHFIEHMMFNGTAKAGPGELDRQMEFQGGANNAYTGEDLTAYTDWFPSAALEDMMILEADRMQGLAFDPKVFESERGVVASERRLSVDNNNESLLDETTRAAAILAHPYHWGVIGWMSDILNWRRDEVMAYYRSFYAPNNAVLVVVGDFNAEKTLGLIKKYYGPIPASPPPPSVITTEPEQLGPRRVVLQKPAQSPSFLMVYHAPACMHEDYPAMRILDIALLRGESSRLYRRLVSETQLAISVSGGIDTSIDPLLFYFRVEPRQNASLDRIEKAIEEELDSIVRQGISAAELQKAMNSLRTQFYAPLEKIAGKANSLGIAEIYYGGYENLFTWIKRFESATLESIPKIAGKYFLAKQKTVGVLLPEGGAQ